MWAISDIKASLDLSRNNSNAHGEWMHPHGYVDMEVYSETKKEMSLRMKN